MAWTTLFFALVISMFTLITHEEGRQFNNAIERQQTQEAGTIAMQMLNLSQYFGHWRWQNPGATTLPAISSLGLPFSAPDDRIHYALSGGRLWVWVDIAEVPGIETRLRTLSLGSGLVLRWQSGQLYDSQGKAISMTGLTIPAPLSATNTTQLLHLN
ncbi:type IV pilus biogenesis protein PilM [Pantoea cypripedii]|uniref:Pilus assembly protein PilP n=1 Tax=Pantoea cypripedii TaxID=55209 RepID=A0A1X1EMY8_PANCY|nr:type IV pilus biogenesis protein PilM [Pantoea cypripedii]MBP2199317.1 hypothetical protein [Pantoea cypripedii]ORM90183.1 hypothetical protein HA50_26945 [Pantoea cypripedii]